MPWAREVMPEILVIIPTFNEEEGIAGVVRQVKDCLPDADILVVDDGSRDRTVEVARQAGALILTLPHNLGIGGAVQTGYKFAVRGDYAIVARLDGDGQHVASGLPALVEAVQQRDGDIIIGSRYARDLGYRGSLPRLIGSRLFSTVASLAIGHKISDATSGFMAVSRGVAEYCARDYPLDYPEVESLITLHRAGFKIVELPVQMVQRNGGESSINWARAMYYTVKVLISIFVGLLRHVPGKEATA